MAKIMGSDNLYELEMPLKTLNLGLHSIDNLEIGISEPYKIGRRKKGKGNFFYYKKGLYIGETSDDIISYVDGENNLSSENNEPVKRSRHIPEDVKDAVWRRDEGKCTQCGSNENLEFDHMIPHSKGGANTKRNIQLLCESCNRKKSDKIG